MFNFWTKKQKEKILERKGEVQNYLDNTTQEEKSALQQAAINTQNQNFTAAEYNEQARKNGEENWQTAYRNDILGIKDQETEIQKKHRLYNEEKARQEAEYQKRIAENPESALPGDTSPQPSPGGEGINNNIPKIENDSRVTVENKQTETIKNGEQANQSSHLASTPEGDGKNENIDYQNWDVAGWKSRGSSKEELENAVEKKYGTVASWKEDGSLEAVINGEKFSWKIDSNGNPVKTSLGNANQVDINKGQVFQMIQNGNTASEINDYIHKNNLQDDPDVKNQLKQKYISDYEKPILQKYRNLSLQDLHKAVKNGEILPGTEVFNKLPQAEAYNKYQKSFAVIDARKEADFSAVNSAIEIEKIVEKSVSKFFDTKGIEDVTERWKNDPEIKQYRADVYESQKKIIEYRRQMKDIGDEVRKQMGGAPESMIMAEISKRAENIYRGIETETALMNASLGMIGDRKGDFEVEMKMLGYKDGLKKEQFINATDLYYTERARMDKKEQREYEAKTEELAFQRNKAWEMEKMEWAEKHKGGTYETDIKGNLLYIKNGVAIKVKDAESGEIIGMTTTQNYQDNIYKNDAGGYDVLRTYKDGRAPDRFSIGASGKMSGGTTFGLMDLISGIPEKGKGPNGGLWCGEGVNKYLKNAGISSIRISDSWSSKKALIDSKEPVVGGLVTFSVPGKWSEYGHIGIVTGINGSKIQITDWNAKGDGKKNTYEMEISSVINRDGGFINNWLSEYAEKNNIQVGGGENYGNNGENSKVGSYDDAEIPMYEAFLAKGKLSATQEKHLKETGEYKNFMERANLYRQEKQAKQNDFQGSQLFEIYSTLKKIREKPWFAGIGLREDFENKFNFVKNNLTFDKLSDLKNAGATFGALSNGEMDAISKSASMLDYGFRTTNGSWRDRVDHTLKKLEKTFERLGYVYDVTKLSKEQIDQKYAGNETKNISKKDLDNAEKKYFNNR